MSFLIHHVNEGEFCRQGINWRRGADTKFGVIVKLWRFTWYYRVRADYLCEPPNSCKRVVFEFHYFHYTKDGFEVIFKNFEYNWSMRLFRIENKLVTEELLFDMIASLRNDR